MKTVDSTLIELVTEAQDLGYRYLAIDESTRAYAYKSKPHKNDTQWKSEGASSYIRLGTYNLTCDWKHTLIDLNTLTL